MLRGRGRTTRTADLPWRMPRVLMAILASGSVRVACDVWCTEIRATRAICAFNGARLRERPGGAWLLLTW